VHDLYEYIESLKEKHINNQSIVYILEYCQTCLTDEELTLAPQTIAVDENHCDVKVTFENGAKLIFHEGKDDEIKILYTGESVQGLTVKDCPWSEILKFLSN